MDRGLALGADVLQCLVDDRDLFLEQWMAQIDHMEEDVRFPDLVEGAFEGGDEIMGEFPDEADGIGHQEPMGRGE